MVRKGRGVCARVWVWPEERNLREAVSYSRDCRPGTRTGRAQGDRGRGWRGRGERWEGETRDNLDDERREESQRTRTEGTNRDKSHKAKTRKAERCAAKIADWRLARVCTQRENGQSQTIVEVRDTATTIEDSAVTVVEDTRVMLLV